MHGPHTGTTTTDLAGAETPHRPALVPAAWETPEAESDGWSDEPWVLSAEEPGTVALSSVLSDAIAARQRAGRSWPVLARHAGLLARTVGRALNADEGPVPLGDALDRGLERLPSAIDLSPAGVTALAAEIADARAELPRSGYAVAIGPSMLRDVVATMLREAREPLERRFREDVREMARRLEGRLQIDSSHGPAGRSAAALAPTLGATGAQLVDAEALARSLAEHRGTRRLDPERRERIAATVAELRAFAADADRGAAEGRLELQHPNGLRGAARSFEDMAGRMLRVLRAARVARLELQDAYDPTIHDALLATFDWRDLRPDELLLVPPIVVYENARCLRGEALAWLSELLYSGRPVRVIVIDPIGEPEARGMAPERAGYHPGLGYLAVAHREAFVLQSSLGRPEHLICGLRRMAATARPAVAFVAVPRWDAPVHPQLQLAAAWEGRATPCFLYDPAAGGNWAERFDLTENRDADCPWPRRSWRRRDESGTEQARDESFTYAHAALLDPAWRTHFRVVPREAWNDGQVEVATYLATPNDERGGRVPFVWAADAAGQPCRAVITRELAFACADRLRAWHILQELAGMDNAHVRREVARVRDEARAEAAAERARLVAAHEEELERVRAETAGEAMRRLAAVLMEIEAVPPLTAAPALGEAAVAVPPAVAERLAPAAVDDVALDAPYVESVMCTTCNECTNLNGRMFRYDANRQAYLADAASGSFDELVCAAEKCPARCIHPGVPRAGDPTATPDLLARAAAFR